MKSQMDKGAETAASVYLEMRGFKILERNWRRSHSSIDIVAEKDNVKYFVVVRHQPKEGRSDSLEATTPSLLKRLQSSAVAWIEDNKYSGGYSIASVEVAGKENAVLGFIDNLL